jgi:predicted MFS family arabinose efflux permease
VIRLTVLATALMAVGTFAQFVFGVLGPFLVADFQLSRAQFGALTTTLFAVAAVLSPWMGHATDRMRARRVYTALFTVSAAALLGLALSPTYAVLLVFAGMGGVGQALVNPLSNKLVADHIPRPRQGLVMGIKQSGVQMGAVLAGFSLPLLAVLVGWRAAVGAVAATVVVGWLVSLRQMPQGSIVSGESLASRRGGADRAVIGLGVYAFLMGSGVAAVNAYLPLYAHEVVGLTPAVAGTLIGAIGMVGIASRILVGHITDRVGDTTLLLNGLAVIATAAVVFILLAPLLGAWLVWVGALVFGWSVAWNAVAMIAVVKLSGRHATGRASGYVLAGFFAGFIVAPVTFGTAVDATGYTAPWIALAMLLGGVSLAVWVWRRRTGRTSGAA